MADPADARRRAEEALAKWEGCRVCQTWKPVRSHALSLATALRALLAAGPEAKAPGHDRIAELESLLRECNAVCLCGCPDSEHEADECGESCGNDDHECIRVPRAVLAYVERLRSAAPPPSDEVREAKAARPKGDIWDACGCPNPDDCEHVFYEPAPSDAVREAAEMLRLTLGMRDVKHACDDRACSNVALAALNLLAALRSDGR